MVGGSVPHPVRWHRVRGARQLSPISSETEAKAPQLGSPDCREQCGQGKEEGIPSRSKGRGWPGRAAQAGCGGPAELPHSSCSPCPPSKDLINSLGREEKGTDKLGDRYRAAREKGRGCGEAWESKPHRPARSWVALSSSRRGGGAALTPPPLYAPQAGGGRRPGPQPSAPLLFRLQGPGRGWGEEAGPVWAGSGLLGQPTALVVSEVKLLQVPCALPAARAPHAAVIALQLLLPLPLFLRLLCSLHLRGGRRGRAVSGVAAGEPRAALGARGSGDWPRGAGQGPGTRTSQGNSRPKFQQLRRGRGWDWPGCA